MTYRELRDSFNAYDNHWFETIGYAYLRSVFGVLISTNRDFRKWEVNANLGGMVLFGVRFNGATYTYDLNKEEVIDVNVFIEDKEIVENVFKKLWELELVDKLSMAKGMNSLVDSLNSEIKMSLRSNKAKETDDLKKMWGGEA